MDSILLQKQIRDNAEDLNNYLKDLQNWESEMKRKEEELHGSPRGAQDVPPIRSKVKKAADRKEKKKEDAKVQDHSKEVNRIPAHDYAAWEKFDVEKACAEVDKAQDEEQSSSSEDEQISEMEQLREEALYQKEMGNHFVMGSCWDQAIKCYTRAIEADPTDAVFYANRGLCWLKKDEMEKAEADCTEAIKCDPRYVKSYQRRAAARVSLNKLQDARTDLNTVLQLEPKNVASKEELVKVERELKKQIDAEVKRDPLQSTSGRIVEDENSRNSESEVACSVTEEQSNYINIQGRTRTVKTEVQHEVEENQEKLVSPIQKPPHLRSKKPLKRIEIEEVGSEDEGENIREKQKSQKGEGDQKIEESHCKTQKSPIANLSQGDTVNSIRNECRDQDIPPPPKTSVQFFMGWKKVKSSPTCSYLYLKQIPPMNFAKIFQNSLESSTFTEIIAILHSEFLSRDDPAYLYLLGLSQVQRFGALTMFMTSSEKLLIKKLLDHCEASNGCSCEEAKALRCKYELT